MSIISDEFSVSKMKTVETESGNQKTITTYAEKIFFPDDDVSGESQEIQDACESLWTDEVKAAWAAKQAADAGE